MFYRYDFKIFEQLQKYFLSGNDVKGGANQHLSDPVFGMQVVGCRNFFETVLNNQNSFDALVDNPPWDSWFLKMY